MKALKPLLLIIVIGIAGYLIYYFVFLFQYKKRLDEDYKEWYQHEYIEKEFRGIINYIFNYKNSETKLVLDIKTATSSFSYGVICVDSTFTNFVSEKDTIYKIKNSKVVYIKRYSDNAEKSFELVFCE